jgi:hypothetical protein
MKGNKYDNKKRMITKKCKLKTGKEKSCLQNLKSCLQIGIETPGRHELKTNYFG